MQPVVTGPVSTFRPSTCSTITEEAPELQLSFCSDSAGAGPTAMSEAARRQATASLLSDTSRTCHDQRLVSIGRPAYFQVPSGLCHSLRDDLNGRSEPDERSHANDVAIAHAHAPVGDGLAQEPRRGGAVDADDAAARPVGEPRVRARLEGVPSEDGRSG